MAIPTLIRQGRGDAAAWACDEQKRRRHSETIPWWTLHNLIQTVALYALPVLFAITVHEAAHGYAARHFGDNTAYALGRVTLNPIKHIDPVGTILMPLMLYFATSGAFLFGYAKPVPVRFGNLHNPKRDMIWVALAGPGANLIQAFLWGMVCFLLRGDGRDRTLLPEDVQGGILVNVVMFAFNLFPLPPLDGGRILVGLLPLQTGGAGVPGRALGVFHRHGAGACHGVVSTLLDAAH
jgi:Zn-dependent protease